MIFRIWLAACLVALAGCSTDRVSIGYRPISGIYAQQGQAVVQLGDFVDARKVDAHWLGAIRGGFGQPLKVLETDAPATEVVRNAFAQGLAARGMLRAATGAPYTLTAEIEKFDCSQYVRREAHAWVTLTLRETASGRAVMTETFRRDVVQDNANLFDVGAFASIDDLRAVAIEALRRVIDASLDSPKLRLALAAGP
ncbi:MAG TPA: hypothetical protein VNT30_13830 [Stellaceae bacterium]|nr:hypothetical protein [Stellaceae bacterium]